MYYPPYGQPRYQPPYQQPYQQPYRPYQAPFFQSYEPEKRELRKTSCGLGWAFLVALLSPLVLGILGRLFLKAIGYQSFGSNGFGGLSPVLYYLFSGAVYCLFLVVPFAVYLRIKHIQPAEVLPFEHVPFGTAVACVCFGIAACMLANIPASIIAKFIRTIGFGGMPSEPKTDILSANIIYIIYVMIIPPFVEEFVFRGVILSRLRKFGDGFAIFCSALLFGMFHGNFIQIPFAFLVGLVFAFIVVRTGNLWITIFIHALNNGFSLLNDFLERYQSAGFTALVSNAIWFGFIVIGIIALIFMNIKKKGYFSTRPRSTFMPFSTRMGAMLGNPGIILALLYCVGNAVYTLVSY